MDVLFSEIKKKDVIDVCTGKRLGKIKDLTFTFPEGRVKSFTVSGGMFCGTDEQVIKLADVERIGDDAVLVSTGKKSEKKTDKTPYGKESPYDKSDNNCTDSYHPHAAPHCPNIPSPPCPPLPCGKENPFRFDDEDYE